MDETMAHIPVLLDEVLDGLQPRPPAILIDGTLGAGGHSAAWLDATAPGGRVIGLDKDPVALDITRERLAAYGERVLIVHGSYEHMAEAAAAQGIEKVDAILLDLGFSSIQIDDPARGFSFMGDGPLDMRFDTTRGITAADIVNEYDQEALADLIFRYGEDRHARRIARGIVQARPFETTRHLAEVVARSVPRSKERIHPATRAFQALRIAVNDELGTIERALPLTLDLLKPGGRLAVIAFHSLEDRIVKQWMKLESTDCIDPPEQLICTCGHIAQIRRVTGKPVTATEDEIAHNARARSAKLRVAERV